MKRLFLVLLFFGVLCLFSCQGEYGILDYQNKDITAECKINGKYTVEIAKRSESCTITVLKPEGAKGITFTVGEGVELSTGDLSFQVEREQVQGICALAQIFSQSEECLTTAAQKGEESVLTFQDGGRVYQITMGENSLPQSVHIVSESFEYDVEILSIELS